MVLDVGLTSGLVTLWEQQTLLDFIIEVEDQEIPVHKVIMASVSDYFRVMLSGPMLETSTNRVKLQGQSTASVSKLIELVYTGNAAIVKDNALDILGPAVYFQMMKIIEACRKRLQASLSVKNCLEVLSVFMKYSFDDEVEKVKKFLRSRCSAALQHYKPEDTSYEVLQIVIGYWMKSEWDLFLFLKYWVNVDIVNRKQYLNTLMSQIRFGLMSQGQVAAITEMDIFCTSDGSWCNLVQNAVKYHRTPTHQKVLHTSVQAKARSVPMPVIFTIQDQNHDKFHALSEKEYWLKWNDGKALQAPAIDEVVNTIEINNFLIVCGGKGAKQEWHIFDAKTKTWSPMTGMHTPKDGFALIHHEDKLYVLGGHTGLKDYPELESFTADVEQYNFATDTWHTVNKMPTPVTRHAACTYGDLVYVSGGWRESGGTYLIRGTSDVECLDLRTGTWKKGAPMPVDMKRHMMHKITYMKEEVILAINNHFQMKYYQPVNDQWTSLRPHFTGDGPNNELDWGDQTLVLAKGNVLYLINVLVPGEEETDDDPHFGCCDDEMYDYEPDYEPPEPQTTCMQWTVSQSTERVMVKHFSELFLGSTPKRFNSNKHMFGALLSLD